MSTQPIYKEDAGALASLQPIEHQAVHERFLDLLARDQDTGLSATWKDALLEPANPLKPKTRPALKLPVLIGLLIAGAAVVLFVWFSFLQ